MIRLWGLATGGLLASFHARAIQGVGASLSTTTNASRALEDIIPKFPKENEKRQPTGPLMTINGFS